MHVIDENDLQRLYELADLQHPHLKGDNHTRDMITKVYNGEKLCASDAFDCGKYYDRMLNQIIEFKEDAKLHTEYLHAILDFKWCVK
jgi:hypothetical protein